ncbi:MAG: nitrate reductase cytochrome c-type subunit [Flavobacteriaceae bacterium]|nr:nitrate reductase cytochrome c-type subunit [Flavobacteriaceae bacterium]
MKRLGIISLFTLLFAVFIIVWNYSYQSGLEEAYIPINNNKPTSYFLENEGMEYSKFDLDYANMPFDENHQRTLEEYYKNRAYYGAPPIIPHSVKEDLNIGRNSCLQCHQSGGFSKRFKAYAPIVPHPEMTNCKQCHVPQKSNSLFSETNFKKGKFPEVGVNSALNGSPPTIPHPIQMRKNCLSCHATPSTPKKIRVTHPERIDCMQCHVQSNNNINISELEVFIRKNYTNEK